MALPPLAEVEDLVSWPGVAVSDAQVAAAEAVLARASALVRRQAGKTFLTADGSDLDLPDGIDTIVVQAAARFWNNPSGATSVTTGPFSEQFGQAVEAGVYLTQAEKDEVSAIVAVAGTRPKLWTLSTTRVDSESGPVFVYDQNYPPGDPILYGGATPPRPY